MKIHDKFVIELAEVIKGYANDYRTHDPFHLPCDYKFYEISGVAICEESFSKMKPLSGEIDAVLDKIKAEMEARCCITVGREDDGAITLHDAFEIIDKYRTEGEGER